jgi:hypothetical protein
MSTLLARLEHLTATYTHARLSVLWLPLVRIVFNAALFLYVMFAFGDDKHEQAWRLHVGLCFTTFAALGTLALEAYARNSNSAGRDLVLWLNSLFWLVPCAIILASIAHANHPAHGGTVLFAVGIVGVDALLFLLPRTLGGLLAFVEHQD